MTGEPARARRAGLPGVLAAAAVALAFALVALVGPADVDRGTFEWSATADPLDIPLVLSGTRPQSVAVTVPCAVARLAPASGGTRELFTTAAAAPRRLVVATDGSALRVSVAGTGTALSLPVTGAASCDASIRFDIDDGRLRLEVGASTTDARLGRNQQPVVTGLHADPAVAGTELSARIVTQPTGSSPSRRQLVATAGAVAGLVLAVVLGIRRARMRSAPTGSQLVSPFVTVSDGAVTLVALVSAMLIPPSFDDGWVLATVRGFADTGRFGGYFDREGASLVQGGWWDGLLYPLMSATGNVVLLRLPFVVLTVLTWWVLRRWVLDQWTEGEGRRAARYAAAAAVVLVIPAWMTTLRPEPLIALLAVVNMAATVRFFERASHGPLLAVLAASTLAMTAHQTGWVVVAVAVPLVLVVPPWIRAVWPSRLVSLLAAALAAAALAVLLVGFDTDLALIRSDLSDFRDLGQYRYGPFDEWVRPHEVLVFHSAVRRAAMLLPAFGLVAWVIARERPTEPDAQRVALWSAVCGYIGLTLTTSKFSWHYGAVMPCSAALVAAGFCALLATPRSPRLTRAVAAGAVALLGAFALSATGTRWNGFDLASSRWAELREIDALGGLEVSRPVVWLGALAVVACALCGVRMRRGRPADITAPLLGASLAAVCILPVALTWSFLVGDARAADGWSFTGQLLDSATGRNECGLPEQLPVVTSAIALPRSAEQGEALPTAEPDAYVHEATNARVPAADVETWGTRTTMGASASGDRATGRYTTPWYTIADEGEIVFWSVGNTGPPNRLMVETRFDDGTTKSAAFSRATAASYWSIHAVPPPSRDAAALRLVLEDRDPSGWLAVTAPTRASYRPLAATLSDADRVWVAPQYYLYAPCADQPSIRDGYIHPFAVSVVTPPNYGTIAPMMSEATITEIGCADIEAPWFYLGENVTAAQRPCAYRVEADDAAPLLTG